MSTKCTEQTLLVIFVGLARTVYIHIYTVYDPKFGDLPAKIPCIHRIYVYVNIWFRPTLGICCKW